jgi:hypothetical protein
MSNNRTIPPNHPQLISQLVGGTNNLPAFRDYAHGARQGTNLAYRVKGVVQGVNRNDITSEFRDVKAGIKRKQVH